MLSISRKRFLRKPLVINRTSWDDCTSDELVMLFKILQSPWYSLKTREEAAKFLELPEKTSCFPIEKYNGLVGPREKLRGMTFGQWAYLERKMFDLNQERTIKNTRSFLACLYTHKKKAFNTNSIVERELKFVKVTPEFVNASIRSWDGIRKWVYGLYPYVFPTSGTPSIEKPKAPEYVKIMRNMAGSVADVEVEKIFNSNVHSILSALNDQLKPRRK